MRPETQVQDGRTVREAAAAWLAGEEEATTITELAARYGVTSQAISWHLSSLRQSAGHPVAEAAQSGSHPSRRSAPVASGSASLPTFDALLVQAETAPELTDAQSRRLLSVIAVTGPDAVRVAAIRALDEKDRAAGGREPLPGPTTPAEADMRMLRMMRAFGLDGVDRLLRADRSRFASSTTVNTAGAPDAAR